MKALELVEIYPHKSFYRENEKVVINIVVRNNNPSEEVGEISISLFKHHQIIDKKKMRRNFTGGKTLIKMEFNVSEGSLQGFGVEANLGVSKASTAFDVLNDWFERPRYGFLADFYREDEEDNEDILSMLKYHINVVQYYDWMYKHEDLVPKNNYYTDLLGRDLSKKAVKSKIEECHKCRISTLAYGAIYAASREFFDTHKEWALYTNDNRPQNLGNWFYIMNISENSPWREHIIKQFQNAVVEMNFDGIHMDTYGFPKTAYSNLDGNRKIEHLDDQFESLIDRTKLGLQSMKNSSYITFNAVSNWAIEKIAKSVQNAIYIEVWDPQDTYYHIYQLVKRAKELSNKQVILAAYFKPYADTDHYTEEECHTGFLLTSATIFASGGFHFALGEKNGVLPDPYYVKYKTLSENSVVELRRYYDFIVRYGNLLFSKRSIDNSMTHTGGENTEYTFNATNTKFSPYPKPDYVWTLIKEQRGYKIIQLINYTNIVSDSWNEAKERRPKEIQGIKVRVLVDEEIKGIYVASPDFYSGHSYRLDYQKVTTERGTAVEFIIESLRIWSLIYIEIVD